MNARENNYYIWFRNIVNACIALFFLFSLLSNLFVYASVFQGLIKYAVVLLLIGVYLLVVYRYKDLLKDLLNRAIDFLSSFSFKKLLLILIVFSVFLKVFYTIFFFFDSTKFGQDITVYANLADSIAENGLESVRKNIYYLVGMGLHLSIFKKLSIPYHVGVYLVFLLGTIVNFYSFSKHVGKEKAFLLIALYLAMPSTSMLSFCITHELFVYMYFSIIFLVLNELLISGSKKKLMLCSGLTVLFVSMCQTISPMGKIWFILLVLLAVLTVMPVQKKIAIIAIVVLSLLFSNFLTTRLEGNAASQNNNYEQLLIGSDLESMGRHTDGKGKRSAEEYWEARGQYLTTENFIEGQKGALIEQYKYLITHPLKLGELLANKFYVAWSGDYYSIEYGHNMGIISDLTFYGMLIVSAVIWLFVISVGVVYFRKKDDNICVMNYKTIILGVAAVLLITEIMNKYSCYMTLFIYFVAFARAELKSTEGFSSAIRD